MKHLGDITQIRGWEIEPVDCVTGGSPCQDLSIAGKGEGMKHEDLGDEGNTRSGLFMEQIRIVKEMRASDRANGRTGIYIRPRYMVWENVPGAFSSDKGADFQTVLTEIVKIVEPQSPDVPMPEVGKWPHSGCLYDELGRWSIAWRVHDAQFWGVPQRRKRIALIADFGGLSAPEILFERKGLSGDLDTSGAPREKASDGAGGGADRAISFQERAGKPGGGKGILIQQEKTGAISAAHEQYVAVFSGGQGEKAGGIGYQEEIAPSLKASTSGTNTVPSVITYDARGNGDGQTVCTITGDHESRVTDYTALCVVNGQMDNITMKPIANTLDTMHDQQAVIVFDKEMYNSGNGFTGEPIARADNVAPTVRANNRPSGVCVHRRVRRLIPMECERLQGYPDNWTLLGELKGWTIWTDEGGNEYPDAIYKYRGADGKMHKTSDTVRYKALGNSIALPFWFWLMRRISAQYERPATMGSLFDGIGGFPLCWERCNGKGTARWASEVEPFCVAVTSHHFPEEDA